jgi:HEAT repeat protein
MSPDLPVACSLDAPALARRQAALRAGVLGEAAAIEPLPEGMRFRFRDTAGLIGRLAPIVDAERQCCRFLHFAIDAQPALGEVTLEVTGPPGTAEVLRDWIAS